MTGHGPLQDNNYLCTPWDFASLYTVYRNLTSDTTLHCAQLWCLLVSDAICRLERQYMGHQDQDGEKGGQMSLFDQKLEAATDREKQKFIHFQVPLSNLSCWSVKKSSFRFLAKSRVRTVCPKLGVFSKFSKYSFFVPLILSS